jgi:hypothetical protein
MQSKVLGDLLRSLSGIAIIHNPSQIVYKKAFLLHIMGLETRPLLPPLSCFLSLFLDNLTQIMYNQNWNMYNTGKFSIIHNLIFVPHLK